MARTGLEPDNRVFRNAREYVAAPTAEFSSDTALKRAATRESRFSTIRALSLPSRLRARLDGSSGRLRWTSRSRLGGR
jgi:hypothetical protein